MNSIRLATFVNIILKQESCRLYHLTKPLFYPGQDWRKKNGFAANPNAYGALVDLPDYTFVDGRRTPPGSGKVRRALEQKDITANIIRLTAGVDYAVERRERLSREEEEKNQQIINSKLKPKWNSSSTKPPVKAK